MPYHILLDDEPEGPHSIEVLAEMVALGRIDAETPVWQTGMDDWLPAANVPELAHLFDRTSSQPPVQPAPPSAAVELDITAALTTGFTAHRRAPRQAVITALLFNVLPLLVIVPLVLLFSVGRSIDDMLAFMQSPEGGMALLALGFTVGIVMTVFYGGLCVFMLALIRGQPVHSAMLYAGFRRAGALAAFAGFYIAGVMAGLMALVVPGIVIAVGFCLTPFIIMESGLSIAAAMGASWRAVLKLDWWRVFVIFIALFLAFLSLILAVEVVQLILMAIIGAWPMAIFGLALELAANIAVTIVSAATFAAVYEQARRNRSSD
jgi:hypothetical protein